MQRSKQKKVTQALGLLFSKLRIPIPKTLNQETLKRIYYQRIFECHPDRAKSIGIEEVELANQSAALNDAYIFLNQILAKGDLDTTKYRLGCLRKSVSSSEKRSIVKRPMSVSSLNSWRSTSPKRPEESIYTGVMPAFWDGPLPERELRLGRFLYYKGAISWQSLVQSLIWQASQRPALGQILVGLGYMSQGVLREVVVARKEEELLGQCALRLGVISLKQLEAGLVQQQKHTRPVGAYFLKRGLLRHASLKRYLQRQTLHNQRYATLDQSLEQVSVSHQRGGVTKR